MSPAPPRIGTSISDAPARATDRTRPTGISHRARPRQAPTIRAPPVSRRARARPVVTESPARVAAPARTASRLRVTGTRAERGLAVLVAGAAGGGGGANAPATPAS